MKSPPCSPAKSRELALVVDSHPGVGAVLGRMLAEIGIASVVASGSRDARELIEQHGGSISFVLAEVDGAHDCCGSLLRELRTDRPDVRIICLTADGTRLPEPLALLADNRLTKPFTAIGLSDAVSRARAA